MLKYTASKINRSQLGKEYTATWTATKLPNRNPGRTNAKYSFFQIKNSCKINSSPLELLSRQHISSNHLV